MKIRFGKYSFYLERLQGYYGKLNFAMILYLFIGESGIDWWWFLLLIPLSIFVAWFDAKYILPEYLAEFMKKNPEWKKHFETEPR